MFPDYAIIIANDPGGVECPAATRFEKYCEADYSTFLEGIIWLDISHDLSWIMIDDFKQNLNWTIL